MHNNEEKGTNSNGEHDKWFHVLGGELFCAVAFELIESHGIYSVERLFVCLDEVETGFEFVFNGFGVGF